jgi:mono/diheme cytochrome c family protein
VYAKQCAACHGPEGRGDGPAAYLLYPKPRDFTSGRFRLVSTWEKVPTDEDLFRTITRGMPGSAMPSWEHLPERTRWALAFYVKSLVGRPLEIGPAKAPGPDGSGGRGVIVPPPEPPWNPAARARALELFADACASCHGATARGDGVERQQDEEGFPTRPRDLTRGIFKGEPTPADLYRRIVAGLPGTPMPESSWAWGDDAWHLVHWILSLSSEEQRESQRTRRLSIRAVRVPNLPEHPDDGRWGLAPATRVRLMPLWWRPDAPDEVVVQALHDGKALGLRLSWHDSTHSSRSLRPQDFADGAAVQFALDGDPPLFAMGSKGQYVNLWLWKADRQADLAEGFRDVEGAYPAAVSDLSLDLRVPPAAQPIHHAPTLRSDPLFLTGWGAANPLSDPTHRTAAEDLVAQGFGTLRTRPSPGDSVVASGVYSEATYGVVFRRALRADGPGGIELAPGRSFPVAFAVWDGAGGDRDGRKSVSIWQELILDK